jgi:hypothetical protein
MADEPTQPPFLDDYSGVREYIGARYVPIMANPIEWDNSRGYEPLTIVLHQGNSYTSMQTVPPGIDITNTEFWALTGNYNAQVEMYRQEVQGFDERITENTENITNEQTSRENADNNLQGKIDEINSDITQINSDITQINSDITQINSDITSLEQKKKLLIIGDSYSTPYTENEKPQLWWQVMSPQIPDYEIHVYSENGAGFYNNGVNGHNFTHLLQLALEQITDNIDTLIVYGGTNDRTLNVEQIQNAFTNFSNVASSASNIQRIIYCIGNCATNLDGNHFKLVRSIQYLANQKKYACINSLMWLPYLPINVATQTGHPNQSGQNIIASYMVGILTGGYNTRFSSIDLSDSFQNGNEAKESTIEVKFEQNTCTITGYVNLTTITDTSSHTDPVGLPGYLASYPIIAPIYRSGKIIGTITISGKNVVYIMNGSDTNAGNVCTTFNME